MESSVNHQQRRRAYDTIPADPAEAAIHDIDELVKARKNMKRGKRPSIYKVPQYVAGVNPEAYKPRVVSFGPYHHGDPGLLPMEEHKLTAFLYFQTCCELSTDEIVNKVSEDLEDLQGSYHRLDAKWREDPAKFLQLMVLDGCFFIEVLKGTNIHELHPVFSSHGQLYMYPYIGRDMLLLENQLPLVLLDKLWSMRPETQAHSSDHPLSPPSSLPESNLKQDATSLICDFFHGVRDALTGGESHVLEIYRKNLLYLDPRKVDKSRRKEKPGDVGSQNTLSSVTDNRSMVNSGDLERQKTPSATDNQSKENSSGDKDHQLIIRSATEIREAGIRFIKSGSKSLKDISFKGGELRLPQIVVDDKTESIFLNLMAFEKLHPGVGTEVTDYVYFMDDLIDVDKDVALLCSTRVMVNALGDDESAAKLFNLLAVGATMNEESDLKKVKKRVNDYCSIPYNAWCANLKLTYFQNPWAFISFVGALLGFAILILQAVYDVYGYHRPRG